MGCQVTDRLRAIYERVTTWQRRTFPDQTAASILAHMRKELAEIEEAPDDIEERADMAILAMGVFDRKGADPALDHGVGDFFAWGQFSLSAFSTEMRGVIGELEFYPYRLMIRSVLERCTFGCASLDSEEKFLSAISAKMDKNEARRWPTPDQQVPGEPVEHIRDEDYHREGGR